MFLCLASHTGILRQVTGITKNRLASIISKQLTNSLQIRWAKQYETTPRTHSDTWCAAPCKFCPTYADSRLEGVSLRGHLEIEETQTNYSASSSVPAIPSSPSPRNKVTFTLKLINQVNSCILTHFCLNFNIQLDIQVTKWLAFTGNAHPYIVAKLSVYNHTDSWYVTVG